MKFNCIICKGQDCATISSKTRDSKNQVVKCKLCTHIQLHPKPSEKDDIKFYNRDLQTKLLHPAINIAELKIRSEADTSRRVKAISKTFAKNQSLLDIGTGYGFFLEALKKAGFNPTGIEIGKDRRIIAKKVTSVPIWSNKIKGPNRSGKKFDIICLFHVLEHIQDPIKLCSDLKSYLKKNRTLIIEVPNTNHYLLNIDKHYRNFYWQRAHISYFTAETVKVVLKKAGFRKVKIVGVQRYTFINAANWLIFKKPQLKNPSYKTGIFSQVDNLYRKFLINNLSCDTLWIEAKV